MQSAIDSIGIAIRIARQQRGITQAELADKLHMNVRTIIAIERGHSNPRFETVELLAKELNISVDAVLFPDIAIKTVPKIVIDFFSEKSEAESQKYIQLCQQADSLRKDK